MRALLLGSSALMSTALAVGMAQAADGVKLTIGGRYMAAAGGHLHEEFSDPLVSESDLRNYVFKHTMPSH